MLPSAVSRGAIMVALDLRSSTVRRRDENRDEPEDDADGLLGVTGAVFSLDGGGDGSVVGACCASVCDGSAFETDDSLLLTGGDESGCAAEAAATAAPIRSSRYTHHHTSYEMREKMRRISS